MPNEVSKPAFVNLFKGESEATVRLSMGFTVFDGESPGGFRPHLGHGASGIGGDITPHSGSGT